MLGLEGLVGLFGSAAMVVLRRDRRHVSTAAGFESIRERQVGRVCSATECVGTVCCPPRFHNFVRYR